MEDFDLINQIDAQFGEASEIPQLSEDVLQATLAAYENLGYRAIAGYLSKFSDNPHSMASNIDRGNHVSRGAVFGPYVFSDSDIQQPGVMLWQID